MNKEIPEVNNSLVTHLIEVRKRIILSLIGIIVCALILLPFCNQIYQFIANPLMKYLPPNSQLIATDVISPFFVPIKLTLFIAFFISIPNTIYQLWLFLAPGLYKNERRLIFGVISSSFILFIIGVLFCYYLVIPILFNFIGEFKLANIVMMTDINTYLDFILKLFMVFGIAFETPVIIFLLVKTGVIEVEKLCAYRKYIFVGAFIIAAIVTPPDIFSQTLFALALYGLYEIGILISKFSHSPKSD